MAQQAGKQMKRVRLEDGSVVLLPVDAVVHPRAPKNMTDEQAAKWMADQDKKPLGGTW